MILASQAGDDVGLGGAEFAASRRGVQPRAAPRSLWPVADAPPELPAPSRRARLAAAFLASPKNNGLPGVPFNVDAWYGPRAGVTPEQAILERAKLGPAKVRLLFQTPEVYATDIHEPDKKRKGFFKYGCKKPPKETYKNGLGEAMTSHPWIALNTKNKSVHVHLEDDKTHEVFWDADFKTKRMLFGGGRREIRSRAKPENFNPITGEGVFRAPCVEADDPEPHNFTLSIQGTDGVFESDNTTSWGDLQGMDKPDRSKAFIGFYVRRQPVLTEVTDGEPSLVAGGEYFKKYRGEGIPQGRQVREEVGTPKLGKAFGGDIRPRAYDRWLHGDQDLNMPDSGDDRLYYDYTFDRMKRDWSHWTWLGPENPQNMPMEMDFSKFTTMNPDGMAGWMGRR